MSGKLQTSRFLSVSKVKQQETASTGCCKRKFATRPAGSNTVMFMVICGKNHYRHLAIKTIAASATAKASSSVHDNSCNLITFQAGMCRKSRVGNNIVKTDAKCDTHTDTHRTTPTKTMRNAELNMFWHRAARRLAPFFAIKHCKNRCQS